MNGDAGFRAPRLGPGAVHFAPLDAVFRAHPDLIRVAEIEPQTRWTRATAPDALPRGSEMTLADLASLPQRRLLHGIGSPVGGTLGEGGYNAAEFNRWAARLDAPWTSEHLSILDVPGGDGVAHSCGFLMPPAQTEAQVALAAANIRRRRLLTGRPFAVETGVNYFAPRPGEMADGAFFAAIARTAQCGLLLDLANLRVNARNGRCAVEAVMRHIPRDLVWEVHLSGSEFAHGAWLDAHCGAIDPELAAMAAEIVAELPNLGAIIFEIAPDRVPGFGTQAVLRQMETLHRLWERAGTAIAPPATAAGATGAGASPQDWERTIAGCMLPAHLRPADAPAPDAEAARGFALYARLVASFRDGALAELLGNSVRLLLLALGEGSVRALFDAYAAEVGPLLFPSDEALAFAAFLAARDPPVPGLADLLAFEAAVVAAIADSRPVQVTLRRDIDMILGDIQAGRIPQGPDGPACRLEIGATAGPFVRALA